MSQTATGIASKIQRFEGEAMASPLRLLVRGASSAQARRGWLRVQAEFARTTLALSRYDPQAELVTFDRRAAAGAPDAVVASRRLRQALTIADRARRLSAGRFDPRILGDLLRLGDSGLPFSITPGTLRPSGRLLELARDGSLRLERPVDLGGLGKGLALRWATAAVRTELPATAGVLLDAGGDLTCVGTPPPGGWSVGIEDPSGGDTPLATMTLTHGAIATSSVALRRWRDPAGREVHHLIDPRSGEPGGSGLLAVSVAWSDPAWAEVWSKSLFLAGAQMLGAEARARDLAAWWVEADGSLHMTPAARQLTTWQRGAEALN